MDGSTGNPNAPTRVLIVDDSAVVRGLIARKLDGLPDIAVIGTASNGQVALERLRKSPADVVVLDVEMPVLDGLATLPQLLSEHPGVRVLMASTLTRPSAETTLRALLLGASDCLAKPDGSLASAGAFDRELIAKIRALAGRGAARPAPAPPARPVVERRAPSRVDIVAIGASTGGPQALMALFESLRGAVRQPIVLTQHMPATFTGLLAERLSAAGGRPCEEARDGAPLLPGHCYVAPGGWHMLVERAGAGAVLRLNQDPPENFCRPAVDPMLRSAARCYGPGVLGAILTGMGSDGAEGCRAISEAGGRFIVQDQATSVVWGMPGAAAHTGLASEVLPLERIGPWLRTATER